MFSLNDVVVFSILKQYIRLSSAIFAKKNETDKDFF